MVRVYSLSARAHQYVQFQKAAVCLIYVLDMNLSLLCNIEFTLSGTMITIQVLICQALEYEGQTIKYCIN